MIMTVVMMVNSGTSLSWHEALFVATSFALRRLFGGLVRHASVVSSAVLAIKGYSR